MKLINERIRKKTTKNNKEKSVDANYSESMRAKWFCCAFKLGFFQLMCKASLIFKSNLELDLFISYFKRKRELYESKHVAVDYRCLKLWDFSSLLICSSILNF